MTRWGELFKRHWIWLFVVSYAAKWCYLFHLLHFRSEYPIVNNDYIQYYARVLRILEFFKQGRAWGYDPYEMAGYPAALREVGTYFLAVLAKILSFAMSVKTAVLLCEMAGHALVPLLLLPSIRNFGGGRRNVIFGFALLAVFYNGLDLLSSVVITQGIFGFTLGCFVAMWHVSLFWKWLGDKQLSTWAWMTVASSVLPQLHPSAALIGAVPLTVILIARMNSISRAQVLQLMAAVGVALLTNLYWLRPYFAYAAWVDILPYWESGWYWFVQLILPVQANWNLYIRALAHLLLLAATLSALRCFYVGSRIFFAIFVGWIVSLVAIVFVGSHIPFITTLQPFRFVMAFWLVLLLCAALGPAAADGKGVFGFLVIALFTGWYQNVSMADSIPLFSTTLTAGQQPFVDYLRREKPFSGRLMVECGYRRRPNIADLCAVLSKQPLLGGHDPGNFLKGRFTVFGAIDTNLSPDSAEAKLRPRAFGRPLREFVGNEKLFADYLQLYNVTRIAVWSLPTLKIVKDFEQTLTMSSKVGEYTIFDVNSSSPNWLAQGAAQVTMDYDQIRLAHPTPGILVLKFHWIKSLKTKPALPISPFYMKDDPIPFIKIDNSAGASSILIYNAGL